MAAESGHGGNLLQPNRSLGRKRLDKRLGKAKIPPISGATAFLALADRSKHWLYEFQSRRRKSPRREMAMNECKHPRVQIVSREEDAEFVECLECGDIFESSELKDMNIEETRLRNEN